MCAFCMCGVYSKSGRPGCGEVTGDGTCGSGCKTSGNTCRCGSLAITENMFNICQKGPEQIKLAKWRKCSANVECSLNCVMNYITRNGADCVGHGDINRMSCEEQARIYKGGKAGCKGAKAQQFANSVLECCGKSSVYIQLSLPLRTPAILTLKYMCHVHEYSFTLCPSACLSVWLSGFYLEVVSGERLTM